MAIETRFDFTQKDFVTLRDELVSRIPTYTPSWTDWNESDIGITLLELFCYIGDQLLFYLDQQTNECFLPTARLRKNVINICKMISYQLDSKVSSTCDVTFSIAVPIANNIIIPKFTRVSGGGVSFVTTGLTYLPVGDTSVAVPVVQGVRQTQTATADGAVNQYYVIDNTSVATGYVYTTIDGDVWTKVDNFLDSGEDDKHFIIRMRSDERYQVEFGDGEKGLIPISGASILFEYVVSDGDEGNVGFNIITSLDDQLYDTLSNPIMVTVNNNEAATGGAAKETVEHAKIQAPVELASLWRMVTLSDYEALVAGYPGVYKVKCYDINDSSEIEDESLPPFRLVVIYVIPNGGGLMSTPLKTALGAYIEQRAIVGNLYELRDVEYVSIDVACSFYMYTGYVEATVKANIVAAIQDYISIENLGIGETVRYSQLISAIQAVDGVSYVSSLTPNVDQVVLYNQSAISGTITVTRAGTV